LPAIVASGSELCTDGAVGGVVGSRDIEGESNIARMRSLTRRATRVLLFPILTVGIAAAIMWNARRGAPASTAPPAAVEEFVRAGLNDVSYGATEPFLVSLLRNAWPRDVSSVSASVAEGADANDGATHRVELRGSANQVRLVVRVHYDADPARRRFVGFAKP
jgi:hypothetical protein